MSESDSVYSFGKLKDAKNLQGSNSTQITELCHYFFPIPPAHGQNHVQAGHPRDDSPDSPDSPDELHKDVIMCSYRPNAHDPSNPSNPNNPNNPSNPSESSLDLLEVSLSLSLSLSIYIYDHNSLYNPNNPNINIFRLV